MVGGVVDGGDEVLTTVGALGIDGDVIIIMESIITVVTTGVDITEGTMAAITIAKRVL